MTFEKVLQAMKEGKKVKRKAWDFNYEGYCTNQDLLADDWEIVGEEQPKLKIDQFGYLFEVNDKLECVTFDNIDISNTQPNKNRVKLHCDMEVSKDVFNGLIELQRRKTKNEI